MSGFRKFLLQGNLVSLAVAVVMASAFGAVVTAFVTIIGDIIAKFAGNKNGLANWAPDGIHIGAFIIAFVGFLIVGAVVYFFIVVPYTKSKERFFPDPEPGATTEDLLTEIRDLLAARQGQA